ncbi:cathepsin B, putative [Perkinsus marinus ATCC 50983]|uniref:Cathepsin B, putative n=1 Tax=Perkinsus marinus (strain ATCC 50983 / TXsc) TaxID=423536 RepID=C5KGL3_PERM5|nr:cathepsin B, putative [Perkinsus marinus ATCC 50983]EER16380.1 cathepsin B, putative [Perkinsus marinus ATCC 50983]|eukprot:XP_002784584.1 cathepsin B, putative [Perkinsus marinus ATCC 50983]
MSVEDLPRGCSFSESSDEEIRLVESTKPVVENLPPEFDARQKFNYCRDVIGHVRDQGRCGNCWAVCPTEVLNDRLCIKSSGKIQEILSAGYVTSCCNPAHGCLHAKGCNGGRLVEAMSFLRDHGVVTGNDFKPQDQLREADGCWPYPFQKCNHVPTEGTGYPKCKDVVQQPVPPCRTTCTNKAYKKSLEKDVHRAKSWRKVLNDAQSIKQEIFDNGPVFSAFEMYKDFRYYKSGVYVPTTKEVDCLHVIKIIGWGADSVREYWLAMNAWNEEWGDHGLIKMAFGKNRLENGTFHRADM